MDAIMGLARKRGITVIEDAAHSIGARYRGCRVGPLADMTILSFHPVKHITTGEGGMVLTDSEELAARLALLRTHGITRDASMLIENHGPWYYEMQALGYHYRITDIQCALGLSQLKKLDAFISRRRALASRYIKELSSLPGISFQAEAEWAESSYHLFVIRVDEQKAGIRRKALFEALRSDGIGVNVHYIPVHLQPYYRDKFGYKKGDYPESERYYESAISLPLFPGMTDEEAGIVIASLRRHVKGG
jgi:dTDP-4-amino-4,6-dideoxygalactose transaminase